MSKTVGLFELEMQHFMPNHFGQLEFWGVLAVIACLVALTCLKNS